MFGEISSITIKGIYSMLHSLFFSVKKYHYQGKRFLFAIMASIVLCFFAACGNNELTTTIPIPTGSDGVESGDINFGEQQKESTELIIAQETDPIPTELTVVLKELELTTPYGCFFFSGNWIGEMTVEFIPEDADIIRGFCETGKWSKVHLFDVCFGEATGELLGYVKGEDGATIPVYMQLGDVEPDENWTDEEQKDFFAMQAEINSILSQLNFVEEQPTEPSETEPPVEVQTSYFSFCVPGRFADILQTEVREGETVTVSFYGTPDGVGKILLYDFVINGDSEIPLGFYTLEDGRTVSVDVCNFQDYPMDNWSEEAQQQFHMMMECVNDIILALEESGNFSY